MNRILLIAANDLRLFLLDRTAYFWLFGSPLLFAFFFGFANRSAGPPSDSRPAIAIENQDRGFIGRVFVRELRTQGLNVITNAIGAEHRLRIPADATEQLQMLHPIHFEFRQKKESGPDAGILVEARIVRALIALNSFLFESAGRPLSEDYFAFLQEKPAPVTLRASYATHKPLPAGSSQSVPGMLVMFVMMNLLIFGGATVASERREGVLKRLLVHPLSLRELVLGKILGLSGLGFVQILVLLLAGRFGMSMQFSGNLGLILLVTLLYATVAASSGVLIGSIISRQDKVVAVCVLASIVMAALGGCWWPLEIVPEHIRVLGYMFPTAWTMEALHQLISFGGGLREIMTPLAVLGGFLILGTLGAIRFFRA